MGCRAIVRRILLFSKLRDAALDGFKVLNHIGIGIAFRLVNLLDLAVLGTGFVSTLEAFGGKFLLVGSGEGIILCLRIVAIFDRFGFSLSTCTGLQLGDAHGRGCLGLCSLLDEVLIQRYACIKVVSESGVRHDTGLDGVKLVCLDAIQEVAYLGTGVDTCVTMFHESFHDRVLRLVNVYIFLKVPTSLFSVIDGRFEFIFGHRGHVVYVIRAKEVFV